MSETVVVEGWSDFFVATAGAAGALAGLIIVAMTVNITQIIAIPSMTSRAAATIGSLILIVVTAAAGLIPAQPDALFGVEVLVFALAELALAIDSAVRMLRAAGQERRAPAAVKGVVALVQILPFVLGAVLVILGADAGVHAMALGILLVFVGSVANAWVLLVEILR